MELGNETWKWALVVVLLGVFLVVGNQAYKSVFNADNEFPPPDDWQKGDSYDSDYKTGPGMGQPVEVPNPEQTTDSKIPSNPPPQTSASASETEPDWEKVKDPSQN